MSTLVRVARNLNQLSLSQIRLWLFFACALTISMIPKIPTPNFENFWGAFYYNMGAFWKGNVCLGHDNEGADITISVNTTLPYSVECNVGTFTVDASVTATIPSAGRFTIYAQQMVINGVLTADAKGYAATQGPGGGMTAGANIGGGHGGVGGNSGGAVNDMNIWNPTDLGSGGGDYAGGGFIKLVASGTLSVAGTITANGGGNSSSGVGAGAGGTVKMDVGTLDGTGLIRANGGGAWGATAGRGGGGRIAYLYSTNNFAGTIQAASGSGSASNNGGAGTVYARDKAQSFGVVTIDNGGVYTSDYTSLTGIDTSGVSEIIVKGLGVAYTDSANISNVDMTIQSTGKWVVKSATGTNTIDTLLVQSGGTLTHDDNTTTKENWIDITASNATVEAGGIIYGFTLGYSLKNGPGAATGSNLNSGGAHGGNGGNNGSGGYGTAYDSFIDPTDLGSGGDDLDGGGYVKLTVSSTLTVDGTINMNGGYWTSTGVGGGAGGAVNIHTGVLAGAGTIMAEGGDTFAGSGGGGRIAYYYDSFTFSGTISAAGRNNTTAVKAGGAGTIYARDNALSKGILTIQNSSRASDGYTPLDGLTVAEKAEISEIIVKTHSYIYSDSIDISGIDVTIQTSSRWKTKSSSATNAIKNLYTQTGTTITHDANTTAKVEYVDITATESIILDAGSRVIGDLLGYTAGNGPGAGGATNGGGAHGGNGGGAAGGAPYDSVILPDDLGSGGEDYAGGGLIKLTASDTLTISGSVTANGNGAGSIVGAGSGGGIYLDAGVFTGAGTITANGGNASSTGSSGSGGRVAYYYDTNSFSGLITARSGTGPTSATYAGGAGTIYARDKGESTGIVTIDNSTMIYAGYTPLTNLSAGDIAGIREIIVKSYAVAYSDSKNISTIDITLQNLGRWITKSSTATNTIDNLLIQSGGTLTHNANTTVKAEWIDVTATSVTVDAGGKIYALGLGYTAGNGPGAGTGDSGGAYGGNGGQGGTGTPGTAYGSITAPDDLGSGGAGTAGGGLIKLTVSGTTNIDGLVTTEGVPISSSPTGSGGSIYINTGILIGAGTITASGGAQTNTVGADAAGGGGRIALYYTSKTFPGSIKAVGGRSSVNNGAMQGGAGTIFEKQTSGIGRVTADNTGTYSGITTKTPFDTLTDVLIKEITSSNLAVISFTTVSRSDVDVIVKDTGQMYTNAPFTLDDLTINATGKYTHDTNTTTKANWIEATLASLTLASGGTITADGAGYSAGNGPGAGTVATNSGGAHGGNGGTGLDGTPGTGYGLITAPDELGSGGGATAGGGYIKLTVSGTAAIDGIITANGTSTGACGDGSGSGGGIYIDTNTWSGAGTIRANGGNHTSGAGGCAAGGGGKVAVIYTAKTFTGTIQALGGVSSTGVNTRNGGAGTVYEKSTLSSYGDLLVNNGNTGTGTKTPLAETESGIGTITVSGLGVPVLDGGTYVNATMTIASGNAAYANKTSTLYGLTVSASGTLTHDANTTALTNFIDISAAIIDISGVVTADGKGYSAQNGTGKATASPCGAGHGGTGGCGGLGAGTTYDSNTLPADLGSGGWTTAGGGLIQLRGSSACAISGTITANGTNGGSGQGTGSGGSIYISCSDINGNGTIGANGGNTSGTGGSGAGGRVATYYDTIGFLGFPTVTVTGGTGSFPGGAGTNYDAGTSSYPGPY